MDDITSKLEEHTAGSQAIGFDYQFYYFMLLALELRIGQKVGFEVKDDVHIDKEDGTTVLFQAKHTVTQTVKGTTSNLATLDSDLWKTLSNWASFITADKKTPHFLDKHSFVLVTNKNSNNNDFIDSLVSFKKNGDVDTVLSKLNDLKNKTQDSTLKSYIQNVISLKKRKGKLFFEKLTIETGTDEIIGRVKNRIFENVRQNNLIDPVFESLSSNLQEAKYTEIKSRNKFEFTFEEFNKKFGKCFKVASENKPLPKRNLPVLLPDDLEEQFFVKQLIDIGEIQSGASCIRDYTTQMLKFLNDFTYWSDESFLLPTDIETFKGNSIQVWMNEFRANYRAIEKKLNSGTPPEELEETINDLAIKLVDYIRRQDLTIPGFPPLGIESSNGHYYALSDNLEIGWHYDWKNKYKKP